MNKTVKVLSTAALAATLVVPVAAPAFAATYEGKNITTVSADGTVQDLGKVLVKFNASELTSGDYLLVTLPSDFKFNLAGSGEQSIGASGVIGTNNTNKTTITAAIGKNYISDNALQDTTNGAKVEVLADNQLRIKFNNIHSTNPSNLNTSESEGAFYINLNGITVPSSGNGEVKVKLEGKSGSAFSNDGEVVVATAGTGAVSASIDSVKSITDGSAATAGQIDVIRLKEDRPDAWKKGDQIKIKLPQGFKWKTKSGADITDSNQPTFTALNKGKGAIENQGDLKFSLEDDGRKLVITDNRNHATTPTLASYLLLNDLSIEVSDETLAKKGDVVASISSSGSVSASTGDLLVARYGDYSVKVYAVGEPKNVTAGQTGEALGSFAIEESVKESLLPGRTITLTLDGKAKWAKNSKLDDFKYDDSQTKYKDTTVLDPSNHSIVGSDRKTLKITIKNAKTSNPLKAVLKDAKIDVSPEAEGDIKVIVGGTAGVTGEMVLGKVVKPVTASVDGTLPTIAIGQEPQAIGDIVVKENNAEAIDRATGEDKVTLIFPEGVTPTLPTSVDVTEGDLSIDKSSVQREFNSQDNKWRINLTVKSSSSKASAIKFSGIKVTVNRTVPEGPLTVEVGGSSLVKTLDPIVAADNNGTASERFPGAYSVAKVDIAKIGTPAAGKGSTSTAVFKLNSKTFTVDGKEVEMDVQPLVKWDRAYVPVRFAANALGVSDDNILWDDKTQTVTIMKDGKIVQMTVGKKEYTVNGVKVPMDAPVLRNKAETNNRTMLPLRYIANALNVPVDWNKETSEITLGEVK